MMDFFRPSRAELARLMNDAAYYASFAQPLDKERESLIRQDGDRALQAIAAEIRDLAGL
jgi:hypothetical protein